MNGALGMAGIALGLAASLLGAFTLVLAAVQHRPRLVRSGVLYVWLVLGGAVLAVVAMERALITRDFSLAYVAEVGSTRTPALYNVASLWSSLDGSILLWTLILALYVVATRLWFRARLTDPLVTWALVVLLVIAAFFFLLLAGPANPFSRVSGAVPTDGPGPNPLLQNHPLMVVHPPMLYLGYVGFSVPFAFAIGGLVTGPRRRGVAARHAALDALRLGVPVRRDRPRRVVELRGAGLGRRVGLGPGGERQPPAVADGHRVHPLGAGAGAAGDAAGLEPVAARRRRSA